MASDPDVLVDTSVAVPLLVADHDQHALVRTRLGTSTLGLAGHAMYETYSVLTRLPPPARRAPDECWRLVAANFSGSRFLDAGENEVVLERIAALGLAGGQVYDAMIGAVAASEALVLATRDRRALDTYRAMGAAVQFVA